MDFATARNFSFFGGLDFLGIRGNRRTLRYLGRQYCRVGGSEPFLRTPDKGGTV